jgi:uncharacterized protein
VLVCASAAGYYGDRGDEVLTEESEPGHGFLAEVAMEWEAAAEPAAEAGMRVVNLRFGHIVSGTGGFLPRRVTPFRFGVGGKAGSGRQWVPWVSLDDVVGIVRHAIHTETLKGPVNAVAPQEITETEFASTLGRVLGRPSIFPAPAFMLKAMFGQMADETVLASARVQPTRLSATRYTHRWPGLEGALRHALGR